MKRTLICRNDRIHDSESCHLSKERQATSWRWYMLPRRAGDVSNVVSMGESWMSSKSCNTGDVSPSSKKKLKQKSARWKIYKQDTHLKKQPFNCSSTARHYTRGRTLFMGSVTRFKNPKSVEKVLQISNKYPKIKITYKLSLRCINMHRPGIHVDRCCPQSKMLAPLENPGLHCNPTFLNVDLG